jgi:cytidyltransferase-like protein
MTTMDLFTSAQVAEFIKPWQAKGINIVLTSGSFDVFHGGHLKYLDLAAQFGDELIVGVDSDPKVRARKGPGRPVVTQEERMQMVSLHPKVSAVILKSVDWPKWHLVELISPSVLVVSDGTYSLSDLGMLATKCGQIEVLRRTVRYSTSARLNMLSDYGGLYTSINPGQRGRISLDQMFLNIALIVSQRSTCSLIQVGAVLARDGRTLSTGYNGAPIGEPHCECTTAGDRCPVSTHAELNAIVFAARNGTNLENTTLYLTHNPCYDCSAHIINVGVSKVVFDRFRLRSSGRGVHRLQAMGIEVFCHTTPELFTTNTVLARTEIQ